MKGHELIALLAASLLLAAFVSGEDLSPRMGHPGNVPAATLDSLGLAELEPLPDSAGMEIRGAVLGADLTGGMSPETFSFGASSLFGQLSDPGNPGNFVTATDINGGRASDANAGLGADALTTQGPQGSSIALRLDIVGTSSNFTGTILGNAGNASNAGAAGFSAATGN